MGFPAPEELPTFACGSSRSPSSRPPSSESAVTTSPSTPEPPGWLHAAAPRAATTSARHRGGARSAVQSPPYESGPSLLAERRDGGIRAAVRSDGRAVGAELLRRRRPGLAIRGPPRLHVRDDRRASVLRSPEVRAARGGRVPRGPTR